VFIWDPCYCFPSSLACQSSLEQWTKILIYGRRLSVKIPMDLNALLFCAKMVKRRTNSSIYLCCLSLVEWLSCTFLSWIPLHWLSLLLAIISLTYAFVSPSSFPEGMLFSAIDHYSLYGILIDCSWLHPNLYINCNDWMIASSLNYCAIHRCCCQHDPLCTTPYLSIDCPFIHLIK